MIHIYRRENSKGNWWVNTTVDCYDHSFEERMLSFAETEMMALLFKKGYSMKDTLWHEPQRYVASPPPPKRYQRPWLDKGMV